MNEISIETLLRDHQGSHSEFQMNHFVVGRSGGLTSWERYRQALRELAKRHFALIQLRLEAEELSLDIAQLATRWRWLPWMRRRTAIALRRKDLAQESLMEQINDTQREHSHFLWLCRELKAIVGTLTPKRRVRLDEEMWETNLRAQAALEMMSIGVYSMQTAEMLMAMPPLLRGKLITELEDPKKLVTWLKATPEIPEDTDVNRV